MRIGSARLFLAALLVVGVSGCTSSVGSDAVSTTESTASVPTPGQWVGAAVDVWFSEGTARLCLHDGDPGFSMSMPPCDEALEVTGIAPDELRTDLLAQGSTVRTRDGVDIVPAFVVGTVSGRTFELESLDYERYAPSPPSSPSTPEPSFATGEEKEAYASSQPVPQPQGCTAPPGGWRSMADRGMFVASDYQHAHPDVLLGNGQTFVSHSTQIALVTVAADADPEQVAADLAAAYPDALCVRQSGLTADDLRAAEQDPVFAPSDIVLQSSLWQPDNGASDNPEPVFTVYPTVLTDALVERAAEYPEGLVDLHPWFEPVPAR